MFKGFNVQLPLKGFYSIFDKDSDSAFILYYFLSKCLIDKETVTLFCSFSQTFSHYEKVMNLFGFTLKIKNLIFVDGLENHLKALEQLKSTKADNILVHDLYMLDLLGVPFSTVSETIKSLKSKTLLTVVTLSLNAQLSCRYLAYKSDFVISLFCLVSGNCSDVDGDLFIRDRNDNITTFQFKKHTLYVEFFEKGTI